MTTRSSNQPDLASLLGEVRSLTAGYKATGPSTFESYLGLVNLLLRTTVMRPGAAVRLHRGPSKARASLGGMKSPTDPVPLNGGGFLRITTSLFLGYTDRYNLDDVLKVESDSTQYQLDEGGARWVFRYDYGRYGQGRHPGSHVQIRGVLQEKKALPKKRPLGRVHLATGRISLEAVIRVLIEQFDVPPNRGPKIWRPVLAESERAFLEIAHQPLSGPA